MVYISTVPSNDTCTTNGNLRLVGGANQYEGRVEFCYNNQWGTVCDNSWGTSDAGVACKQLGYSGVGKYYFDRCSSAQCITTVVYLVTMLVEFKSTSLFGLQVLGPLQMPTSVEELVVSIWIIFAAVEVNQD